MLRQDDLLEAVVADAGLFRRVGVLRPDIFDRRVDHLGRQRQAKRRRDAELGHGELQSADRRGMQRHAQLRLGSLFLVLVLDVQEPGELHRDPAAQHRPDRADQSTTSGLTISQTSRTNTGLPDRS